MSSGTSEPKTIQLIKKIVSNDLEDEELGALDIIEEIVNNASVEADEAGPGVHPA